MGETTSIGWTHHTFNPWIGCTEVHAGCAGCYARELNKKYKYNGGTWGKGTPRHVTSEENWRKPLRWAKEAARAGERHRCFFSMGDPLDEEAPLEAQERFWQLIRETANTCVRGHPVVPLSGADGSWSRGRCSTPVHSPGGTLPCSARLGGLDHLLLTKRPSRWRIIPADARPLVWLLTSVSDQATADRYIPELLAAEGFAVRGVSLEPMIGPVDLTPYLESRRPVTDSLEDAPDGAEVDGMERVGDCWERREFIRWVIVGGESGSKRRPSEVAWYESIAAQCSSARVPLYVKQDTAFKAGQQGRLSDALWARKEFPVVTHG